MAAPAGVERENGCWPLVGGGDAGARGGSHPGVSEGTDGRDGMEDGSEPRGVPDIGDAGALNIPEEPESAAANSATD